MPLSSKISTLPSRMGILVPSITHPAVHKRSKHVFLEQGSLPMTALDCKHSSSTSGRPLAEAWQLYLYLHWIKEFESKSFILRTTGSTKSNARTSQMYVAFMGLLATVKGSLLFPHPQSTTRKTGVGHAACLKSLAWMDLEI